MVLRRCYDESSPSYDNYGGRGIYVDSVWLYDPTAFIEWSLANGSASGLHLDRVDNEGPYSPDNCRYTTPSENMRNRRTSRRITAFGETKTVAEWFEDHRCQTTQASIYQRLKIGWTAERAITEAYDGKYSKRDLTAYGETKCWTQWLHDERCRVGKTALLARIDRGWDHEKAITTPPDGTRKGKVAPNAKVITAWGESKTVSEWLDDDRCIYKSRQGIWERINKHGWEAEKAMTQPPGRGRPKKS